MNSRAGAQVPFSSINYGTDTSPEARMVIRNLLEATSAGLGDGETPIFPVQIFKVKEGVNYNEGDPNYDLFKLACKVSAKRLFPNFSFIDAPFNLQYYKKGDYNSEVAYMGCRTRVMGNNHDKTKEVTCGRGNLSFTSVNLPRIGIEAKGDLKKFYELLDERMDMVIRQLLHRFEIQCSKKVYNYPFLMGQGVWIDSEKLGPNDSVREVLKHGTLSMGFIGLAETLKVLTGKHHGESAESQKLGLEIVGYMRKRMDEESAKTGLNFTLLATPAEGLSGRFVRIDQKKYGKIPGVTDREYYTNSFHIPVYYPIKAFEKIKLEAPYHALTNAGHISYVELDGDTSKNLEAFEAVIRCMKENGIGYGSVNHPVDRDPVCGFNGIIDNECPKCHRSENDGGPKFERIRRITGYLVGPTDRWNNAKRAEERDRVKHGL
ncbi:MAG: anaerobic ribonucleoside triphosphate reductase, partial [Clostridiales bacterium]|nr:anaerobic ribonucleoside triphosphate reductase [Clostridiales bacterium]